VEGEVIVVIDDVRYDETRRCWRVPPLPPPRKKGWQLPNVPLPVAIIITLAIAIGAAKLFPVKPAAAEKIQADAPPPQPTTILCPAPPPAIVAVAKMPEPSAPPSAVTITSKAGATKRPARPAVEHRRPRPRP
jgi:hypothetical protein